jgi:hypothetical protein
MGKLLIKKKPGARGPGFKTLNTFMVPGEGMVEPIIPLISVLHKS